jgi:TolB-like protein/Tfp pilus assembly protein PilF
MNDLAKRTYTFGRFRLDAIERVLLRDGEPVSLTPKALETLVVLVENSGHIVEKDYLMKSVWPDTFVSEDSLTRNISILRRTLGVAGDQFIETLSRRGYRFSANVAIDDAGEIVIARRARMRIITEEIDDEWGNTSASERLSLKAAVKSLAVLPFKSLSSDEAHEYLGLGIADALITRLSNVRQIVVRPTSAVLRYIGLSEDTASIGRKLQVESVLEGGIQKLGERIRVTVQLVSVDEGAPLWAETFDENFTDIFGMEDSISAQVVAALTLKLSEAESKLLRKRYTEKPEAYEAYLKGRRIWNKRTPEGIGRAIEYFDRAIGIDPDYAIAYAGLADCYNMAGFWAYLSPKDAFPKAAAAADAALERDDTLAEAHASLAWAKLHYDRDRVIAESEYRRSIELNPGYVTAHQWYALLLMQEARFGEASSELKRAQEIDPLSLAVSFNVGLLFFLTRRYDEAISQLQRTLDLEPNYSIARQFIALSYGYESVFEKCIAEYQSSVETLRSSASLGGLGLGYAIAGRSTEARALLDELQDGVSHAYVSPVSLAQIYLQLGETDRALEYLERGYEERDPWLLWNKVNPVFAGLRSDARFQDLLARIGLSA